MKFFQVQFSPLQQSSKLTSIKLKSPGYIIHPGLLFVNNFSLTKSEQLTVNGLIFQTQFFVLHHFTQVI